MAHVCYEDIPLAIAERLDRAQSLPEFGSEDNSAVGSF